jgi:energy-coupling factor transporter ATP-binding protein EcfA2
MPKGGDEREERARREKAAALKELAESRFSVLIGPAGTGKTTLLAVLCGHLQVTSGGVLLLAPTGKARVRMEQAARKKDLPLRGFTIAQFLRDQDRYDPYTNRYSLSDAPPFSKDKDGKTYDTVIVDEAPMLTEEMLGALLDAIRGAKRIILVGDHRQLPPIGPGRPFVDIITEAAPPDIEVRFPRVAPGYAELTMRMRQAGAAREDLQLAEWFAGSAPGPGEDDIFDRLRSPDPDRHIEFASWTTAEECQRLLLDTLRRELKLAALDDVRGFDLSLGATEYQGYTYFNRTDGDRGVCDAADRWQMLSTGLPSSVTSFVSSGHSAASAGGGSGGVAGTLVVDMRSVSGLRANIEESLPVRSGRR